MRISKIFPYVTTLLMATGAAAQEVQLEPYVCPEPNGSNLSETWMNSDNRDNHYNSGGSEARQVRGRTYGAFLDSFWTDLDNRFTNNPPTTTGELFDGVGESYLHAYNVSGDAPLSHGVTPQLFLDTAFRNRTETGGLNINDIVLTPENFDEYSLSQNPDLQELLPFEGGSLDNGISISIRFMADWGDYLHAPIASGLGQFTDLTNQSPIESLIGFTNPDSSYFNWSGDANIKDGVVCPQFFARGPQG